MTDITTYFIPDLRQDIEKLPAGSTQADMLERINLLSALVNKLIMDNIGDDGEPLPARTK